MAKSSRASTTKANNARLKSRVFGPVETARTERLSAKLMELASQPRVKKADDVVMEAQVAAEENNVGSETKEGEEVMEVDQNEKSSKSTSSARVEKKRSSRKASIVFPKYKNGKRIGGKAKKQKIY